MNSDDAHIFFSFKNSRTKIKENIPEIVKNKLIFGKRPSNDIIPAGGSGAKLARRAWG